LLSLLAAGCGKEFVLDATPCSVRDVPGCVVSLAGGGFSMGAQARNSREPGYDFEAKRDEAPVHRVVLSPFLMDRYEVTVAQFRACVEDGACSPPGTALQCNWKRSGRLDHPINCVDQVQVEAYCAWVGAQVPTEAQWEYAARGSEGRRYPWGEQEPDCQRGNYFSCELAYTAPVGSFPAGATPDGVHDLAGNVWERLADWYDPRWYERSPEQDPGGPVAGSARVKRGGSWWNDWPWRMKGSSRYWVLPEFWADNQGFRCVRAEGGG